MNSDAKQTPLLHEIHGCFGRYMEPGKPWTESNGRCSQECPRRSECYRKTHEERNDPKYDHKEGRYNYDKE